MVLRHLAIPLVICSLLAVSALVIKYISGDIEGTVNQAIEVVDCEVPVGNCDVSPDGTSFEWILGNVYQGDEYTAYIYM